MRKLFFGWIAAGILLTIGVFICEQQEAQKVPAVFADMKAMAENENYRGRFYGTGSEEGITEAEKMERWRITEDDTVVVANDTLAFAAVNVSAAFETAGSDGSLLKQKQQKGGKYQKSRTLTRKEKDQKKDQQKEKKQKEETEKTKEEKTDTITGREKQILLRIVEAEATGESVEGRMLVANVVLNRVRSESFPDTVEEVVFQCEDGVYQFSPIADGRYASVTISDKTREAVERVLDGEDASDGALYFMARSTAEEENSSWFDNSLTYVMSYGGHEFYR